MSATIIPFPAARATDVTTIDELEPEAWPVSGVVGARIANLISWIEALDPRPAPFSDPQYTPLAGPR